MHQFVNIYNNLLDSTMQLGCQKYDILRRVYITGVHIVNTCEIDAFSVCLVVPLAIPSRLMHPVLLGSHLSSLDTKSLVE